MQISGSKDQTLLIAREDYVSRGAKNQPLSIYSIKI